MIRYLIATSLFLAPVVSQAATDSSSNRSNKAAYVAYDAFGLTLMPVAGPRIGYFVSKDFVAEAGFATGDAKLGEFEANKKIIEVKAKKFFGNSFYVDGGIGYETWEVSYPVAVDSGSYDTRQLSGNVQNTGVELHIGNQWQWDGFTLGCDWVGYFLSLNTSTSFNDDSGVSPEKKEAEEKDVKQTFAGNSPHITRFYVGWAF
jgi:hypothetical protein